MSLELRNIRKCFGQLAAVDGISVDIRDGEFFSLLGPSGCGKTTLLRVVAGILEPDAGAVVLAGTDITNRPMHARNIALVFQNYALFPHLTVHENVAFGLTMRGVAKAEIRERVAQVLDLVRLPAFGDRYPAQISGGQQQRVALARALVVHPEVLLLDEPLSNLDAKLREEMRTELKEIQRHVGITTILVTHDIHEAFALSDRVAVLNQGKVEQIGTAHEVYQRPRTRFVAEFAGLSNHFVAEVEAVEEARARLRLDDGLRMWVAADETLKARQQVSLVMRPEKVRLNGAASTTNRYTGVVEQVTYLGGLTSYRLRVGESIVLAQTQNLTDTTYDIGDQVSIGWDEHDCIALPGE